MDIKYNRPFLYNGGRFVAKKCKAKNGRGTCTGCCFLGERGVCCLESESEQGHKMYDTCFYKGFIYQKVQ